MILVALKGLAWRKVRSVLTALAVVLGVAMVSGTYVLTDTIHAAFDEIFATSYRNTSAIVTGRELVGGSESGGATVPESLVARLRRLPDVAAAAGAIADVSGSTNRVKLVDRDGKAIGTGGAPTFGFGIDTSQPRFNPMRLTDGRWASGPGEVVVDKGTANKHGFEVGGRVSIAADGPVERFRIVGLAKYGDVESLGGATIAVFDIPTAQRLLHMEGQLDSISLAARRGVSDERLAREVRPLLPATATVQTAAARAAKSAKDTSTFIEFIQYFLLAFAAIALFVGAFVIFNTLSITIAQRARELATLRTIGASRRQVLGSVLLESLVLGALASGTGLVLGLALAKGLSAVFRALGLDLPQAGTVLAPRTVVVSLALGTAVTVVASLVPAVRATRVPPIAAVREEAVLPPPGISRFSTAFSVGLVLAAVAALGVGSFAGGLSTGATLLLLGLGTLALFVGVALVAKRLVRPLARAIGAPGVRLGGVPARLARANSLRNPARTAATAAALMIGLALVTLVATLGAGLRASDRAALDRQVRADYVVTSQSGFTEFPAQAVARLPAVPGVGAVSAVLDDRARIFGADTAVDGVDPATIGRAYDFQWASGSDAALRTLGRSGAIVKRDYADEHGLRVGSSFTMLTPSGKRLEAQVRGISDPPVFDKIDPLLADVIVSRQAFAASFPRPRALLALVDLEPGAPPALARRLEAALARFPDAKIQTKAAWIEDRAKGIDMLLNLLYVLLALSVVVSLFGMVNTLVLAVFERTRELGMLRAVGMTRGQVRRMVRAESVITALIGAALGLPLGLFLAGLVTRALSDQGLGFAVPAGSLAAFALVAVAAGLGAAVAPARRAARLDVLTALHYE
ncbi:MAG: ABC transporter permease [Thermoleophilaceae bacterium]|nr:ABC transporter permease [Thermoleophilaceae bacterium]